MNLYQETFLTSATAYPKNVALWTEQKSFTYQALVEIVQLWAKKIVVQSQQHSLQKPLPIAIYGGRQWQMYAGILSILAAKSAYVPLNNKQPASRNASILQQVGSQLLLVAANEDPNELLCLSQSSLTVIYLGEDKPNWFKHNPQHSYCLINQVVKSEADKKQSLAVHQQANQAYILFTSGSTGIPKGIAVSQQNIISHIHRLDSQLNINSSDKVSQFFELSFDLSVHDLFSCWAKGAALFVIPDHQLICPMQFIKQHQLTVFSAVASVLSFIDKFGLLTTKQLPSLKLSCFGGEKLLTKQALQWQACANNSRVLNLYGPTECTITALIYQINSKQPPHSNSVPIGNPLSGLTAILVRDEQVITTTNTLAELYLAGDQLVDGYWQDEEKTAQTFVHLNLRKDKDESTRYYKTGDLAYYDENNNLVFHARNDHQFKVSGHRIEATDIETNILHFNDCITWCTVKAIADKQSEQTHIHAFIESEQDIEPHQLQQYCLTKLPRYMVPDHFHCQRYLPRNASGKVDIKLLNANQAIAAKPE